MSDIAPPPSSIREDRDLWQQSEATCSLQYDKLLSSFEAACRLMHRLADAEADYRKAHDLHGSADRRTGRAWDAMRHAGDEARSFFYRPAPADSREVDGVEQSTRPYRLEAWENQK